MQRIPCSDLSERGLDRCGVAAAASGRTAASVVAATLEQYRIGQLADAPAPPAQPEAPAHVPDPAARPSGRVLLGLPLATYLDGRYRGVFSDRGAMPVNVQFERRDHHFHNVRFRSLSSRDGGYRALVEHEELHAVMRQHRQAVEYSRAGSCRPSPEDVVDDINAFNRRDP